MVGIHFILVILGISIRIAIHICDFLGQTIMYSDRNFNIRPEYRERLPRIRVRTQNEDVDDFAEIGGMLIQGFAYLCGLVVILFAACLLAAIVGWLWSFTQTPQHQPLTERSQYVD